MFAKTTTQGFHIVSSYFVRVYNYNILILALRSRNPEIDSSFYTFLVTILQQISPSALRNYVTHIVCGLYFRMT